MSHELANSAAALFAVVIPLYDDRGVVLQAIDAWLSQRSADRPFDLIVVDSGNAPLAREVASRLGPQDSIVTLHCTNEARLYNHGAQAVARPWILFSEAHVVPAADAVAKLYRRLQTAPCDAATLGSSHRGRSHLARVEAQLMSQESDAIRALGLWRVVSLRGFVIRRDLFLTLGAFNENYYRFAETALAIHIVERGLRLEEFPEVILEHCDPDSIHELLTAMALGRLGAHRFWAAEPELAVAYFNCQSPAIPSKSVSPEVVRLLWRHTRLSLCGGTNASVRHMLSLCTLTLLAATVGVHLEKWQLVVRSYLIYFRLLVAMNLRRKTSGSYEPYLGRYRFLRERCAAIGSAKFRSEKRDREAVAHLPRPLTVEARELQAAGIAFYPPEIYQGEQYCWSGPQAAVRLKLEPHDAFICLDARPTGGWLVRRPQLYLNGLPIPPENITEHAGRVGIVIPDSQSARLGDSILSWSCLPFRPARAGLPDQRQLGVALISIQISKLAGTASHPARRCAA